MILIDTVYAHSLDSVGAKILLGTVYYHIRRIYLYKLRYIFVIRDVSDVDGAAEEGSGDTEEY